MMLTLDGSFAELRARFADSQDTRFGGRRLLRAKHRKHPHDQPNREHKREQQSDNEGQHGGTDHEPIAPSCRSLWSSRPDEFQVFYMRAKKRIEDNPNEGNAPDHG